MGVVITVNNVLNFPESLEETIVGQEVVTIEGSSANAETKIYDPNLETGEGEDREEEFIEEEEDFFEEEEDEEGEESPLIDADIENYMKYIIKHNQRYSIVGSVDGKEFREILRIFSFDMYKNDKVAITLSKHKGKFAHSALKRLSETTSLKFSQFQVDLLDAIEKIINSNSGITINSGWFSNLGLPNLDSALLRGDDVNRAADWERFKQTQGASLSNIELIVSDTSFPSNQVKISLSKRGLLHCRRNISPAKSVELTERIFSILYPSNMNVEN